MPSFAEEVRALKRERAASRPPETTSFAREVRGETQIDVDALLDNPSNLPAGVPQARALLSGLGVPTPGDESEETAPGTGLARNVGRAGAFSLGALGALRGLNALGRVSGPAGTAARAVAGNRFLRPAVQQASKNPVSFLAEDFVGNLASEAAADQGAGFVGQAGAGIAGTAGLGITRSALRGGVRRIPGVRDLAGLASPAERKAVNQLRRSATSLGASLDTLRTSNLPFDATLGAQTRDPGLLSLERVLARDKTISEEVLARREGANQFLTAQSNALGGQGSSDDLRNVAIARTDAAVSNVRQAVEQATGQPFDAVSPRQLSTEGRELLQAQADRVFNPLKDEYNAINAQAAENNVRIPVREFQRAARDLTEAEFSELGLEAADKELIRAIKGVKPPGSDAAPTGLVDQFGRELDLRQTGGEATISIEGYDNLKRAINDRFGQSPVVYGKLRDALEASRRLAPDADALRQVDAAWAAGARRFKDGVTGDVLDPKKQIPGETALGKFFVPSTRGNVQEAAEAFRRATGNDPQQVEVMRRYIIADAIDKNTDTNGILNAKKLDTWMKQHREALKQFPEVADDFSSIMKLQRRAEELGIERFRTEPRRQFHAIEQAIENPDALATRIVQANPQDAERMVRGLKRDLGGDENAIAGLQRVVWENLQAKFTTTDDLLSGTSVTVSAGKVKQLVQQHRPMLRALYGGEHLQRMEHMAELADTARSIQAPGQVVPEPRPNINQVRDNWISLLYNKIFSITQKIGRGTVAAARFVEGMTDREAEVLLAEAFVNPRLAERLMRRAVGREASVRFLNSELVALGLRDGEEQ